MTEAAAGERFFEMLLRLFEAMRSAGIDVSLAEVLDAAVALEHLGIGDRSRLRNGLQATLVKRPEDVAVFGVLFDRCFPRTPAGVADAPDAPDAPEAPDASEDPKASEASDASVDLLAALLEALRRGDDDALAALAAAAVDAHAGIGTVTGGERYFLYRTLRALDLSKMLSAAMRQARLDDPDASPADLRAQRDVVSEHLEHFRQLLAIEIHGRLHPEAWRSGVGLIAPRRLEDVEVSGASRTELREMRRIVRPLAKKLAARVGERRRRHRQGRLDTRRTVRRSLASGGVPLEPQLRRRRRTKPSVVVLCDISGSVAEFAHFTLMLLHSLTQEVAGLRSFVFVDGIAEVTRLLQQAEVELDPRLLVTLPGVIDGDGHSDHERAFRRFLAEHPEALTPKTTVLIAGDARTNYRPPGLDELRSIRDRSRRLYWFNPEPRSAWDAEDCALGLYREHCDGVFEVRSLNQLADAIAEIL